MSLTRAASARALQRAGGAQRLGARAVRGPMQSTAPLLRVQLRGAATRAAPGTINVKSGAMFAGLSAFAVALTVYGVYEYYTTFLVWPKELREPLRSALKAKNRGNFERSARYFRRALDMAREMDPAALGKDRLLKLSGIAIALGDALESGDRWQDAALVYVDALDEVLRRGAYAGAAGAPGGDMARLERMRAVALAQKVAELAQEPRREIALPPFEGPELGEVACVTEEPREQYLVWSVQELLRLLREAQQTPDVQSALLSDLHLPPWVSKQDIGASVEALGAFYAEKGVAEYAVPLYLQAISVLMPVSTGEARSRRAPPTVAERCRAAILMNNIGQVLANGKMPPSGLDDAGPKPALAPLEQAVAWAAKGLDLATITSHRAGFMSELPAEDQKWLLRFSGFDPAKAVEVQSDERLQQVKSQCLGAQFVLLYNLGMLRELQGDKDAARTLFKRAYRHADQLKLREARSQCARSLARLERDATA